MFIFGLVVKKKLPACEGSLNSLKIFVVSASREREVRIKEVVAILATDLGLIESLRGLAEELVGIDILGLWIAGDAGAGGKLEREITERDGLRCGVKKQFDGRMPGIVAAKEDRDELIAAEPREGIVTWKRGLHAMGNSGKKFVADRVTMAVVNGLEIIEIETHDGQDGSTAVGLHDGMLQAFEKENAIGQAGEQI